mmetsp:Transcript_53490/g.116835  ORF Transcript_53490/g.116835 Transcript_53490/m.116835 type:complete len:261 (+) Transcript_53490:448-1230(+)
MRLQDTWNAMVDVFEEVLQIGAPLPHDTMQTQKNVLGQGSQTGEGSLPGGADRSLLSVSTNVPEFVDHFLIGPARILLQGIGKAPLKLTLFKPSLFNEGFLIAFSHRILPGLQDDRMRSIAPHWCLGLGVFVLRQYRLGHRLPHGPIVALRRARTQVARITVVALRGAAVLLTFDPVHWRHQDGILQARSIRSLLKFWVRKVDAQKLPAIRRTPRGSPQLLLLRPRPHRDATVVVEVERGGGTIRVEDFRSVQVCSGCQG